MLIFEKAPLPIWKTLCVIKTMIMINKRTLSILATLMMIFSCANSQDKNKTMNINENHIYLETPSLDDVLEVNSNAIENLNRMMLDEKFGPEQQSDQLPLGYVGFLPEESRPIANKNLNESINRIILILRDNKKITARMILNEFEIGLKSFNDLANDTEDRERVCRYYEDIMDIIGLESSNELLNNWMY